MGNLPNEFEGDAFISYAHLDNIGLVEGIHRNAADGKGRKDLFEKVRRIEIRHSVGMI